MCGSADDGALYGDNSPPNSKTQSRDSLLDDVVMGSTGALDNIEITQ